MLAAYWGYLGPGGLLLGERAGFDDGDAVVLDIKIRSLKKEYRVPGRVRKHEGRAFVEFDGGNAAHAMLNAAFADSQDTPERRHARRLLDIPVKYRIGHAAAEGRMVNISRGGCCLIVGAALRPGTRMNIELDHHGERVAINARVRWASARNHQIGVEFDQFEDALLDLAGESAMAGH
jgi:hypothetical protein